MHGVDVASVRTCQESNLNLRRRVERANANGLFLEMQFPWIGMHSSEIAIWDSASGRPRLTKTRAGVTPRPDFWGPL